MNYQRSNNVSINCISCHAIYNGLVCLSKSTHKLMRYSDGLSLNSDLTEEIILFSCYSKNIFVYINGNERIICLNTKHMKLISEFNIYPETPTCIAISESHSTVAIGTRNGFILLCDYGNGKIFRKISLNGQIPKRLILTGCWGFIVVHHTSSLSVYTINGSFITTSSLKYNIQIWNHWTSCN